MSFNFTDPNFTFSSSQIHSTPLQHPTIENINDNNNNKHITTYDTNNINNNIKDINFSNNNYEIPTTPSFEQGSRGETFTPKYPVYTFPSSNIMETTNTRPPQSSTGRLADKVHASVDQIRLYLDQICHIMLSGYNEDSTYNSDNNWVELTDAMSLMKKISEWKIQAISENQNPLDIPTHIIIDLAAKTIYIANSELRSALVRLALQTLIDWTKAFNYCFDVELYRMILVASIRRSCGTEKFISALSEKLMDLVVVVGAPNKISPLLHGLMEGPAAVKSKLSKAKIIPRLTTSILSINQPLLLNFKSLEPILTSIISCLSDSQPSTRRVAKTSIIDIIHSMGESVFKKIIKVAYGTMYYKDKLKIIYSSIDVISELHSRCVNGGGRVAVADPRMHITSTLQEPRLINVPFDEFIDHRYHSPTHDQSDPSPINTHIPTSHTTPINTPILPFFQEEYLIHQQEKEHSRMINRIIEMKIYRPINSRGTISTRTGTSSNSILPKLDNININNNLNSFNCPSISSSSSIKTLNRHASMINTRTPSTNHHHILPHINSLHSIITPSTTTLTKTLLRVKPHILNLPSLVNLVK